MPDPSAKVIAAQQPRGTYVASRTHHAPMWRGLREQGYRINSTWIDEAGPGQTADMAELWERIAREVTQSSRLVLYIEPDERLRRQAEEGRPIARRPRTARGWGPRCSRHP